MGPEIPSESEEPSVESAEAWAEGMPKLSVTEKGKDTVVEDENGQVILAVEGWNFPNAADRRSYAEKFVQTVYGSPDVKAVLEQGYVYDPKDSGRTGICFKKEGAPRAEVALKMVNGGGYTTEPAVLMQL